MEKSSADYIYMKHNGMHGLVREKERAQIAAALFAGEGCVPVPASGRGVMHSFTLKAGRSGIIRTHLRGGLMQYVLKDRFFLLNRPLREFMAHKRVLERGLAAPPLLGVRWMRFGPWYSGALATELLDGRDLDAWLRSTDISDEVKSAMLRDCGILIRRMHDLGIHHADLQVKNVFISADGPVLLDFDRARLARRAPGRTARACAMLRLRRSFEKRGHPASRYTALAEGYGQFQPPRWLDTLYRLKGRLSQKLSKDKPA